MKVLHLTLKKKWFDLIASGEKREEYREQKPYWSRRFIPNLPDPDDDTGAEFCPAGGIFFPDYREFDEIHFKNGYAKDAPFMRVEFKGIRIGEGRPEWGAVPGEFYFVIELGDVLEVQR